MSTDFLNLGAGEEENNNTGLVFDMSGVEEDKGFEVLPKGEYNAVVDEVVFGDSKAGNPMLTVKYKVTDGEFADRVLFDYWVLGGNGAEFGLAKLKKFLVRVTPDVDLTAFNPQQFAEDGVAEGRELVLVLRVKKETKGDYKGEMRNNIQDIKAPATGSFL